MITHARTYVQADNRIPPAALIARRCIKKQTW